MDENAFQNDTFQVEADVPPDVVEVVANSLDLGMEMKIE